MSIRTSRKPMIKYASQVLRRDSDSIVDDLQAGSTVGSWRYPHQNTFFHGGTGITRVLGIAEQIDQHLDYLVPVHEHRRHRNVIAFDAGCRHWKGTDVNPQGILHHFLRRDQFEHSARSAIALLERYDLFDVVDIAPKPVDFLD